MDTKFTVVELCASRLTVRGPNRPEFPRRFPENVDFNFHGAKPCIFDERNLEFNP